MLLLVFFFSSVTQSYGLTLSTFKFVLLFPTFQVGHPSQNCHHILVQGLAPLHTVHLVFFSRSMYPLHCNCSPFCHLSLQFSTLNIFFVSHGYQSIIKKAFLFLPITAIPLFVFLTGHCLQGQYTQMCGYLPWQPQETLIHLLLDTLVGGCPDIYYKQYQYLYSENPSG